MKEQLLLLLLIIISCQTNEAENDIIGLKETYLKAAIAQIPEISKHDYKIVLGDLNRDNTLDAFIEYGEGEGMRPVSKRLVMLLKGSGDKVAFYPFHTEYCPLIDTISNQKLIVKAYENCFEQNPELLSIRHLFLKGEEIVEEIQWPKIDHHLAALKQLRKNVNIKSNLDIHKLKFGDTAQMDAAIESLNLILSNLSLEDQTDKTYIENVFKVDEQVNQCKVEMSGNKIDMTLNSTVVIEEADMGSTSYFFNFRLVDDHLELIDFQIAG